MVVNLLAACGLEGDQLMAGRSRASAKAVTEWAPGDDIPGWEGYDYDCPLYESADAAVVHFPDIWVNVFQIYTVDDDGNLPRSIIWIIPADCTDFSCIGSGSNSGGAQIFVDVDERSVADVFEKTGYYGTADRPDSYVFGNSGFPLGNFVADGTSSAVGLRICFSRVRPDEMSGVIYVFYYDYSLYHMYYSSALVQYPFESFYEDHYAWDFDYDYDGPEQTSDYWTDFFNHAIIYGGDIDYDNAWDWDAITDPAIRAAVYDRYTPINLP